MRRKLNCIYYISILIFICFPPNKTFAQILYSANAEYLFPIGDLRNNYTSGVNAGLGLKYIIQKEYNITLNASYSYIKGKSIEDEYFVYNVRPISGIPIAAGFRYKPDNLFFIQASGGPVIVTKPENDVGVYVSGGAGIYYKMLELQIQLIQWNKPEIANFAGFQLSFIF